MTLINLYGVENTRLTTMGLITLEILVLNNNLLQDFIVVDRISEEYILDLDALYEHKFIIDGSERKIYRVKKTTLPDSAPTIMAGKKITIKPLSATVVELEGNGAQFPPNLTFYLNRERVIRTGGYLVQIPEELSAEDCKKPYIREFYRKHPLASNITIQPAKSHEEALAPQNPNQKDGQIVQLVQKLKSAIYGENWDTTRKLFNGILDVDPLHHRTPVPPPAVQEKEK
jgi:hypothetical protein